MLHSPTIIDMMERELRSSYVTPEQRAAYRAGMSTAFMACDYVAKECGKRNAAQRTKAETAKLCGDMIEGLREMVRVNDNETR